MSLEERFLVLTKGDGPDAVQLRLVRTVPEVIAEWTPPTRLSPIFVHQAGAKPYPDDGTYFDGTVHLLFLVYARPIMVMERAASEVAVWLTFGAHNVICVASEEHKGQLGQLRTWAEEEGYSGELWMVTDSAVVNRHEFGEVQPTEGWREHIAAALGQSVPEMLREVLGEFGPLFASSMARAERNLPELIEPLWATYIYVLSRLRTLPNPPEVPKMIEAMNELISANAGLSRLSSQTFSGTTPIMQTECHFWSHSLLGTGVANRGLWRVVDSINNKLHTEQHFARFRAYGSIAYHGDGALDQLDPVETEAWRRPYYSDVTPAAHEPYLPMIAFFSGRDGYHATQTTISAPLSAVTAANAEQWTLRTLTHEMSHKVIRQVLALLREPLERPDGKEIVDLLMKQQPTALLPALQRYFYCTVLDLQRTEEVSVEGEARTNEYSYAVISRAARVWNREVEELLVHCFDFLWFYGSSHPAQYVHNVWQSWSVIPSIHSRIPEYVLRTLTTIHLIALQRQQAERMHYSAGARDVAEHPLFLDSRHLVDELLAPLESRDICGLFVTEARTYLRDNWAHLADQLRVRQNLARIVLHFLYDEQRAAQFLLAEFAGGGSKGVIPGYQISQGDFTGHAIDNPIHFIAAHNESTVPSAVKTLWLWHMLAFNTPQPRAPEFSDEQ